MHGWEPAISLPGSKYTTTFESASICMYVKNKDCLSNKIKMIKIKEKLFDIDNKNIRKFSIIFYKGTLIFLSMNTNLNKLFKFYNVYIITWTSSMHVQSSG